MQERYGVDVDAPGADQAAIAAVLREADRADARAERERAQQELTASQQLIANADWRYHQALLASREREAQEWVARSPEDFDGADIADYDEYSRRGWDRKKTEEATDRSQAESDGGSLAYDSSDRRREFAASLEYSEA